MTKQARKRAVVRAKAQLSTVVVVSEGEWERKTKRQGNLAEFFAASPLRGARLRLKRSSAKPRTLEL